MPRPYLYPRTVHRRTETPAAFSNYRQFKETLRKEFVGQCVYCRALDKVKGIEAFGVDHYRPQSLFPHRATDYENLFYACNRCNSLKRDYWPSLVDQKNKIFVPNPCDYVMFEHVRYRMGSVVAFSPAGEFSIDRLDLNDPNVVEFRTSLIRAVMLIDARLKSALSTAKEASKQRRHAKSDGQRRKADEEVKLAESNVRKLKDLLVGLIG